MKQKEQGQSLVEVIIAIGVLMVIVVGFTNLILTSLQNTRHARNQEEANQFARNAIEVVRVVRDQGTAIVNSPTITWDNIWNGTYDIDDTNGLCLRLNNETFPDYELAAVPCANAKQTIASTIFTREIRFQEPTPVTSPRDYINVLVIIQWFDSDGPRSVEISTTIAKLF